MNHNDSKYYNMTHYGASVSINLRYYVVKNENYKEFKLKNTRKTSSVNVAKT